MILVLGATGLLGGAVMRSLLEREIVARSYTRGSSNWKDTSVAELRRCGVEIVLADVLDEEKLAQAIKDCSVIVNLIGAFKEKDSATFIGTHVDAVRTLLRLAKKAGVQRFIHVSCLGSGEYSGSRYLETKWQSEQLIKRSDLYWTILKPSFMFGETFPLLEWLAPLIKCKPFMPVLGSGLNQIQPVCIDDVARCLVECIYDKNSAFQTYELGGPNVYSLIALMERIRDDLGLSVHSFPLPTPILQPVTKLMLMAGLSPMPNLEMLPLLTVNSVCHDNALPERLGCSPQSLEQRLAKIISRL